MSNRSALMLMLSSIGVALSLASCSSDDEVVEGVGGSEAGSGGQSSSVGGSTPKSTANGGTSTSAGGAGGAVTTASAGVAGAAPSATGGTTAAGGSTVAGAAGLAGAGGSGGVAGGNASAGTAGVASTDIDTLCTQLCAIQSGVKDQASADCSLGTGCTSFCVAPSDDPDLSAAAKAAYLAMLQCEVANLTVADYVCSTTAPIPSTGMRGPAAKVNTARTTPCANEICAFSCDADASMFYSDQVVLVPCGCPQ